MSIISDRPLEYMYCVRFKLNGNIYYSYYQNRINAQRAADLHRKNKDISDVEVTLVNVQKEGEKS